ncbi:MAG: permease-like cell division protein FtsX [Actinomycetota bacterium]
MAIRIEYAAQEALTNMRRNFFMTLAAVMVVAVSLFLFGGVFLLRGAVTRSADLLTRKVEVAVFLAGDISGDERDQLQRDLLSMPEVDRVVFESKQEAYTRFKKLFANDPEIVQNTSPDALPESFRVKLQDPKKFEIIRDRLQGRPGIDTIRDERKTLRKMFAFASTLRAAALGMALVVGLAALILIATTIRMAIFARRKEIGIMKLVGATNWFIRVPFMMEGVAQGIVGAVVAIALLFAAEPVLSSLGSAEFQPLGFGITYGDIGMQGIYLLVSGMLVGAIGSMVGLRRFLDV